MAQTAAHLVDHVIPHLPVRQWVLALPIPLRLLLAAQPTAPPAEYEAGCSHYSPLRLSWAKLLKRVFEIDMEHCPNCGGQGV